MRLLESIPFAPDREIIVKELTPREIDALWNESAKGQTSIVDNFLDIHDLNGTILAAMCGMQVKDLEELLLDTTAAKRTLLIEGAKRVNPDFFEVARSLRKRAGQIETLEKILALSSANESADLSSAATSTPGTTA
jgi:hypothetical protein